MTARYVSSATVGKPGPLARRLMARVRCCEDCLARGVRVANGCFVDGNIPCDVCGANPSRGLLGERVQAAEVPA